MNNKIMMNQLCTRNIMKTKMILITIIHRWLMIFHPKKEATLKMKKENTTTMALTTMNTIVSSKKPTHKTKMRTNTPKATSITSKVFTMKSDKAAEVRKTEIKITL